MDDEKAKEAYPGRLGKTSRPRVHQRCLKRLEHAVNNSEFVLYTAGIQVVPTTSRYICEVHVGGNEEIWLVCTMNDVFYLHLNDNCNVQIVKCV